MLTFKGAKNCRLTTVVERVDQIQSKKRARETRRAGVHNSNFASLMLSWHISQPGLKVVCVERPKAIEFYGILPKPEINEIKKKKRGVKSKRSDRSIMLRRRIILLASMPRPWSLTESRLQKLTEQRQGGRLHKLNEAFVKRLCRLLQQRLLDLAEEIRSVDQVVLTAPDEESKQEQLRKLFVLQKFIVPIELVCDNLIMRGFGVILPERQERRMTAYQVIIGRSRLQLVEAA